METKNARGGLLLREGFGVQLVFRLTVRRIRFRGRSGMRRFLGTMGRDVEHGVTKSADIEDIA